FSKAFLALSISGLFAILSSTMSKSPTLPLFAESLGLSEGEIGLVAATSTITGIIVNFSAGALSDIYGRKKLLMASGFFFASAPFFYLFVSDAWQLALIRAYHGIATATFTPVAIALIADIYESGRGEMMGWFSSATMVGRLAAPITAGAVLSLAGFEEAYLLCGIIGVIALVSMSQIPSPRSEGKSNLSGKFSRDILQVLFSGDVVTAGVVMAVTYFAMQSLETFLPIYLGGLGVEPWLIGAIFTIELFTIMILKPYAGRLSDAVGRIKTISLGLVISSIGITGITFLKSCEGLIFSIIIFSIGVAFTTAATPPLVSELVTREKYGAAIGAMETIKDVGQALGPIFTGIILMYVAFEDALLVISGLLIFALPLIYLRLR
ncbi:MAG: MFS transporter, partial [Thaumarchaeota archaeon]|nr:MFS transporter [Nitrososphaerota archaeon]